MTISSLIRKAGPYPGDGTAATFPFAFKVFTASDVEVVRLEVSTSIETQLVLLTDFTVALNADQNTNPGGSVTLIAGNLASGFTLLLTSKVTPLQGTDLTNQGGFYPEVINDALDKSTILIQQQQDTVDRSIKFSLTNTIGSLEITQNAAARSNKVLGFDSAGEFAVTQELGTWQGDWVSGRSYTQRDIVKDPVNANVYMAQTSHTSTGSAPIATNPGVANWALIIDATSAGAAAASAALALGYRNEAEGFRDEALVSKNQAETFKDATIIAEGNAQASETQASADAGTAVTKAAEADASAVAAAASAAAAAAAAGGGAVKISATDTTAGYMNVKFVAGIDTTLTLKNQGGDERFEISSPYGVAYAIALGG